MHRSWQNGGLAGRRGDGERCFLHPSAACTPHRMSSACLGDRAQSSRVFAVLALRRAIKAR